MTDTIALLSRLIGLTDKVWVIISAALVSFLAILAFARPIGEFIRTHPALKILALFFLIIIGVTIFIEGMHKHVPKAYIYLPMGFALFVELLQTRFEYNRKRKARMAEGRAALETDQFVRKFNFS
jgi:predicted tellurium resistance membrane protein TerC